MTKTTILTVLLTISQLLFSQVQKSEVLLLMGSRFELHVVASNADSCDFFISEGIQEIKRIEKVISSWDSQSQTSLINKNAGLSPVRVSEELFNLIARSLAISDMTKGAFDITAVVMSDLWKFDGSMTMMPPTDSIKSKTALINYKNIVLNKEKSTVFLSKAGMKIGFGSIGKGYAASKAADKLQAMGVKAGLINAGGDLLAWGKPINKAMWQVGIVDPKDKTKMYAWLDVNNMAVVTSGDYEKEVVLDGKSYSHIIDPRSGYPVSNGLHSVTIISKDSELADALATSIFVLGEDVGLHVINQLDGVEAILANNKQEIITSDNVHLNKVNPQ